jgi:hypothetical protein
MRHGRELVRVEFRVPVWVHVDVKRGKVVAVHVDGVSLEGPIDVTAYSGAPVDDDVRLADIELIGDNSSSPQWTIGFDHT